MTKTYPVIRFGENFDLKENSAITFLGDVVEHAYSLPDDLVVDFINFEKYASFEKNWWILDGSMKIAPADAKVGYLTDALSTNTESPAGQYTIGNPGTIQILFDAAQDLIEKMVLDFGEYSEAYPPTLKIQFYDAGNSLIGNWLETLDTVDIADGLFENNRLEVYTSMADVKKILINFANDTHITKPKRRLRLLRLEIGDVTILQGESIKSAIVLEEIDPVSILVTVNTFEFEIFTENPDLSIVADVGVSSLLKIRQPLDVYEYRDGAAIYMGRFYVDDWENKSETIIKFFCIDAIGFLENQNTYDGGFWYKSSGTDILSEDLIEEIMTAAGMEYELDVALEGIEISGWLQISSPRDALQKVAFIIGATVSCARSSGVRIYQTILAADIADVDIDYTLTNTEKSLSQSLALLPYTEKVEFLEWVYSLVDIASPRPIYADLNSVVGTFIFAFAIDPSSVPSSVALSGDAGRVTTASITGLSNTTSYFTVEIGGIGGGNDVFIDLDGEYLITKKLYIVFEPIAGYSGKSKTIVIEGVSLTYSTGDAQDIVDRIWNYHQQRYLQKFKLFNSLAAVGDSVLVDTFNGKVLRGVIERSRIDLAGGFVSEIEIKGVVEDAA